MVRIKLTWRSWMRYLSLTALGGTMGTLLLLGIGTSLAQQQGPLIISRSPRPLPATTTSPDGWALAPVQPAPDAPPAPPPSVVNVTPVPQPWALPPVPRPLNAPQNPAVVQPSQLPASNGAMNLQAPPDFNPAQAKPTPVPPPRPTGTVASPAVVQVSNPPPAPMFLPTPTPTPAPNPVVNPAPTGSRYLPPGPLPSVVPVSNPPPPLRLPPAPTPTLKPEVKPAPIQQRYLPPLVPARPPSPPSPPPATLPAVSPPVAGAPLPGATPVTTPDVQKEYSQFVKSIVDPQTTLDMVVGRARLLVLTSAPQRVQVGDEHIVVSDSMSPTELSLTAKAVGSTVLNLWFADPLDKSQHKILSYLVRVYPDPQAKERRRDDYRALADEINRAFPDSQVSLSTVGDKLAVAGQARDVAEAAQILHIVRAHAPAEAGTTADAMPAEGTPDNPAPAAQQLVQAAGPNVVNLLHVPGEQQVMLRVTVAEVDRAAARSIGLNCSVERHDGTTIFSTCTGELSGLTNVGGANVPVFLDNGQIGLAIHALRGMNLAKSIAEPHLAALNGHCAEFSTGGKFPVPGAAGTEFVPYGVRLNFTPIITDRDCIRLTVDAEVSTKDVASMVNVGCTPVPGLNSRTFKTTVELREGQTMAVAGLIQNNCGAASHGCPWLAELPGVGRLFASDITASSEQELIVLITPELVHPLECKDAPPLPGTDFIQPSDLDFYLMGHLPGQWDASRSAAHVDAAQVKRANHCEDVFITGPQGYSNGRP